MNLPTYRHLCSRLFVALPLIGITFGLPHAVADCVTPPVSMVGWYPGDGNANDIIDGNNGAVVGNANYSTGEVDEAFSFDGSNYVEISDSANLSFGSTSPISVDMWVYRTGSAGSMHFIGKRIG